MRRIAISLLALAVAGLVGAASAGAQTLIVEDTFLTVEIDGKPFRLEAQIVKRPDLPGRLPVALLTHGRSAASDRNAELRAGKLKPQASDFALRGWLAVTVVRRGFGLSA